jgi:hypothetical protein
MKPHIVFVVAMACAAQSVAQQSTQEAGKPDLAVISARLGDCSADFSVTDSDDKPVYAAIVHVRIRYGFMSLKRMDLEVGTNSEGKARVEGLPAKARPLVYDIAKDGKRASVEQDLARRCKAAHEVVLR